MTKVGPAEEKREVFPENEVWIPNRADPYVLKSGDWYYFTASVPAFDRIVLRRARAFTALSEAEEKTLFVKHEQGILSRNLWAPELHYLFGTWCIYFAAGEQDDEWKIRPYCMKCRGQDPYTDPWEEPVPMKAADSDEYSFQAFSLDATVFSHRGEQYMVWAEKVSVGKQISNLYIAKMESSEKLATEQVLLTTPDYSWERGAFWVDEGPAVIKRNHRIFLTFSASDTGPSYCVGLMSVPEDADILDPRAWKKERWPVLKSEPEKGIYGPGHNSFTEDEEGNDILVFHARTTDRIVTDDPLDDPGRHAMFRKISWGIDGYPVF